MKAFKPGDLVVITDGTHEDRIPDHRTGLIIREGSHKNSYIVLFPNRAELKFHVMFLEKATST
jgi:hypothetical protein